jgi:hypothetical protein
MSSSTIACSHKQKFCADGRSCGNMTVDLLSSCGWRHAYLMLIDLPPASGMSERKITYW